MAEARRGLLVYDKQKYRFDISAGYNVTYARGLNCL